jgi:hypothetical protein
MAKKTAPQKKEPKKTAKKVTDISGHPAQSSGNKPQLYESNYKKTPK